MRHFYSIIIIIQKHMFYHEQLLHTSIKHVLTRVLESHFRLI